MKGLFLLLGIAMLSYPTFAKDRLCCEEELLIGEKLMSHNGKYFLVFQNDRNLVLYKKSEGKDLPIWASATNSRASRCVMHRDGNFVLHNSAHAPIWSSKTTGHPNANLIVQDDGNMVIYAGEKALWHTNTAKPAEQVAVVTPAPAALADKLCCDSELPIGSRLTSANGRFFLIFQEDRNLVLYKKTREKDIPLWASLTNNRVNHCFMQADGNLVLYNNRNAVWASNSYGHANGTLVVQNDGNMVIYDGDKAVWHTNTAQPAEKVLVPAPAPAPPPPTDRICCGTELAIGTLLTSANGKFFLVFQEDRNLVLYKRLNGKDIPMWASLTNGRVNHCFMQTDGNLVLYNERNAVWASNSYGHNNATLIVQDDGNMVIYEGDKAIWHTNTAQPAEIVTVIARAPVPSPTASMGDKICCDSELPIGSRLTSPNGRFFLVFQEDRNLVLYRKSRENDRPLWASDTNGRVNHCIMQADGNFVLYNDNTPVWASNSYGNTNATLVVQDDGNVVIYANDNAVWQTNTAQQMREREQEIRQQVVQESPAPVVQQVAVVDNSPCAMPDDQYNRAVGAINAQAFRDNKMATAKQSVKNKCLSLAQVRSLAKLFDFEDQTLDFLKYAYDFTNEKSEYYTLADIFSFDINTTAFNKFLDSK